MFEEEITELQADMVDICNEYSCGVADKIFIIASYEGLLNTDYFYIIKGQIFERHKINMSDISANFDVSIDCLREDIPLQIYSREEILKNAHSKKDDQIELPKVVK